MNPQRVEKQTEDESRVKKRDAAKTKSLSGRLKVTESKPLTQGQIDHILENYDYQILHDRIMASVEKKFSQR